MERAQPPLASYTPYGTKVHKQVYIYGSLDFSPTVIDRKFGLTWSVGGYLLTNALARLGGEAIGRMRARVLAEAKTTFASGYAQTFGLRDVLQGAVDLASKLRPVGHVDADRDRHHDAGHGQAGGGAHAASKRHESASRSAYPTPRTF